MASCLLLLLAAAQGYVSFRAQFVFVDHAKRAAVPSLLEALGLDSGAVIFALLALSLARRGRRAAVERALNVGCALGSLTMNLLAADLTSPRSITVWVLPSALYALASDRLIAVVRQWVRANEPGRWTAEDGSAWHALAGALLWILRLIFDVRGTLAGFRGWVLAEAPVAPRSTHSRGVACAVRHRGADAADRGTARGTGPAAVPAGLLPGDELPRRSLGSGSTKRAALIRLYERAGVDGDPRYGDRAKAAAMAREIAGQIGYHPGTARRELARYLSARAAAEPRPEPAPGRDAEARA
jgi:hypothetical protein